MALGLSWAPTHQAVLNLGHVGSKYYGLDMIHNQGLKVAMYKSWMGSNTAFCGRLPPTRSCSCGDGDSSAFNHLFLRPGVRTINMSFCRF